MTWEEWGKARALVLAPLPPNEQRLVFGEYREQEDGSVVKTILGLIETDNPLARMFKQ